MQSDKKRINEEMQARRNEQQQERQKQENEMRKKAQEVFQNQTVQTPPIQALKPEVKTLNIKSGFHTKKKIPIWIATINGYKPRNEYERIANQVKEVGGYWSPYSNGFVFEKGDPTSELESRGLADEIHISEQFYFENHE